MVVVRAKMLYSPNESLGETAAASPSRLSDGSDEGAYRIVTACFDRGRNRAESEGVCPVYGTRSTWSTCALVKPAIDNGKIRVFFSDVMFSVKRGGKGRRVSTPFGNADCTVFRKVMGTEDTIYEFAVFDSLRIAGLSAVGFRE